MLLLAGGLNALQTMTIASALPFAFIMLASAAGLWRALVIEGYRNNSLKANTLNRNHGRSTSLKGRLAAMVDYPSRNEVHEFIDKTVIAAMKDVQAALKAREWEAFVKLDEETGRATFTVERHDHMDFIYDIRMTEYLVPGFSYADCVQKKTSRKNIFALKYSFAAEGKLTIFTDMTKRVLLRTS